MNEDILKRLREFDVIIPFEGELKHAGRARFYIDVKKALGYPDFLNLVSERLFDYFSSDVSCVAGQGHGGISLASIISVNYDLPLVLIRDKPKDHGRDNLIDGYVPKKGDKVEVVDDVITTGGSLEKTIQTIKATGAEVVGAHVVVKRREGVLSVPWDFLLTAEDLL
jgi:orotate phosphoribosyltransferase